MGEISDLIINGDLCQYCMCGLGSGQGYPRSCSVCSSTGAAEGTDLYRIKYQCTTCNKLLKSEQAAIDHNRAAHGKLG